MAQLSVLPATPSTSARGTGRATDRQHDGTGPRFADVMSRHSRQQEQADRPAAGTASAAAGTEPAPRPERAGAPDAHIDHAVEGEPEAAAVDGAAVDDAPIAGTPAPVAAHDPDLVPAEVTAVEVVEVTAVEGAAVESAAVEAPAIGSVVARSAVVPDADAVVAAVSGAEVPTATGSPVVPTSPWGAPTPAAPSAQSDDGATASAVTTPVDGSAPPVPDAPAAPSTGPRRATGSAPATVTTTVDAAPTGAGPVPDGEAPAAAVRTEIPTAASGSAAAPTPVSPQTVPVTAPGAAAVAPATPSSATAPAPYTTAAPLPSQLAPRIASVKDLGDGVHRLTLRVQPEAIGAIRVVAEVSGDSVRMELFGGSEAAREALRAALPELRRDLAASGLDARLDLGSPGERQHDAPRQSDVLPGEVRRGGGVAGDEPDRDLPRAGGRSEGLDVIA